MPRVYDRTPRAQDDKNPLKNLLNFESIDATALTAGTAIQQWFNQLLDAVGLDELLELLTGIEDATLEDLAVWVLSLPLLVRGVLPQWLLPTIHVGRLTNELPPLVSDGMFDQIPAGVPGGAGTWFRDAVKGKTKPGAAAIQADGGYHDFIARPVAVAVGQKYQVGAWFASAAATGTAGCVQLQVIEFGDGDAPINTHTVVSWTPTGTHDFAALSGEYVVPSGVKMAAVSLAVTSGFTAGTAYFDDVTGPSTGLMQMEWVQNLIQRWQQIAALFGIVDTDLDGDVDFEDVWNTLWSGGLQPLGWIPTVAQDIIDRIISAFENLGQLGDLDQPVEKILDAIFGIFRTGLGAAAETAELKARVLALESSDASIVLNFNGGATSSIGSDFDSGFSGAGAGQMGLDGSGNLVWKPSGFLARTQISRYNVATLGTDNCVIEAYLASSPQSHVFDAAYTYLPWRMNTARTSMMWLRIGFGEIRLQTVVAGVVTNIGAAWTGNPGGGNKIDILSGTPSEPRHFNVKLNGTEIIDVEDTGDISQVGALYRGVGAGMATGNRLVLFQNIPAGLKVATFAEVS